LGILMSFFLIVLVMLFMLELARDGDSPGPALKALLHLMNLR